jgi:hypothetical protein
LQFAVAFVSVVDVDVDVALALALAVAFALAVVVIGAPPHYAVLASRYPKALALGLSALQDDTGL